MLDKFPALDHTAAITLVKSARLYQQALCIADATPELAWLMLVSAVETAAGHWDSERYSPVERLKLSHQRVFDLLMNNADSELLEKVAAELRNLTGATGKFIGFLMHFKPGPPNVRPAVSQFDFSEPSFKSAMRKIYGYRSRALHGGTPFPHPMCHTPSLGQSEGGVPEERPIGLGMGVSGATWLAADTPMLLHLFAYITRATILNWWKSIALPSPSGRPGSA